MSRAADRKRHWGRIPEGLDILVTHGPPLGILDELGPDRHDGCPELCEAVSQARPRGRVRNQQKKTWGSKQGGWRGVREIVWETDKVSVGSISKAHSWLPDGALASEVQNCGCKQASGAYTAVAQDAKMEILDYSPQIGPIH